MLHMCMHHCIQYEKTTWNRAFSAPLGQNMDSNHRMDTEHSILLAFYTFTQFKKNQFTFCSTDIWLQECWFLEAATFTQRYFASPQLMDASSYLPAVKIAKWWLDFWDKTNKHSNRPASRSLFDEGAHAATHACKMFLLPSHLSLSIWSMLHSLTIASNTITSSAYSTTSTIHSNAMHCISNRIKSAIKNYAFYRHVLPFRDS